MDRNYLRKPINTGAENLLRMLRFKTFTSRKKKREIILDEYKRAYIKEHKNGKDKKEKAWSEENVWIKKEHEIR